MTDYSALKRYAECLASSQHAYGEGEMILALIAENEELGRYLCTCRDCGGEGALHTGDWHSYSPMEPPEPVMEKCGECDGTGLLGEIQDLYQMITERDQLKAENEALRREVEECAATLPGVTYMDLPDGGAPTIAEQLSRMARDAERWRFVSQLAWFVDQAAWVYDIGNARSPWAGERSAVDADDVESAIDAAMGKGEQP